VRRLDTDSDTTKDNTPVVGLSDHEGNTASPDYPISTSPLFGVPSSYNRYMEITKKTPLVKGQLNKPYLRARVPNEGAESSREVQATVTATNIVGQIIKASKDNITGLALTLESAEAVLLDNFESYASSVELQAVWIASGAEATLDTVIYEGGAKSMKLPLGAVADSWEYTIASTDYTSYTGSFNIYQTNVAAVAKVYIQDSLGNKKFSNIPVAVANEWVQIEVQEAAMTEDPGNGADTDATDIVIIGFEVVTLRPGATLNIDNLQATPPPGSIELKLWDMGSTLPESGVTSIDDGTQYTTINQTSSSVIVPLIGGKRIYHLHEEFSVGAHKEEPSNQLLTPNNYYILELRYVDTDVSVYGPDTSFEINYYQSGYAFTAATEAAAISAIGTYSDLMFFIQSTQDIYVTQVEWRMDEKPNGDADIFVYMEDTDMNVVGVAVDHEDSPDQQETKDLSKRPVYLEDGGKVEFYYNDDYTDSASYMVAEVGYLFEQPTVNG
jgi:hypothetical protein